MIEYEFVCGICGGNTVPKDNDKPHLRTFSFGPNAKTIQFDVVAALCDEHKDCDTLDVRRVFYNQIFQMKEHEFSNVKFEEVEVE